MLQPVPIIRIFGYGSLLNEKTIQRRLPGQKIVSRATLGGYQRTFRKLGNDHVYLTLRRRTNSTVIGTLIDVSPPELAILTCSEPGYTLADITDDMLDNTSTSPRVYCFIAPPVEIVPDHLKSIRRSYLKTCLDGLPEEERERWFKEIEIPEGVAVAEDE